MNPYIKETNYGNLMGSSMEARRAAESFKYNQEDRLLAAEREAYEKGMNRENLMIADEQRAYDRAQVERAFRIDQEEKEYQRRIYEEERELMANGGAYGTSSSQQGNSMYGTTGGTPIPRANLRFAPSSNSIDFKRNAIEKVDRKPIWDANASYEEKVRAATPRMNPITEKEEREKDEKIKKERAEAAYLTKIKREKDEHAMKTERFLMEKGNYLTEKGRSEEKYLTKQEQDLAKYNKTKLENAENRANAAKSFIPSVTKETYDSFYDWNKKGDMLPTWSIPSKDEVKNMSIIEFNQKMSAVTDSRTTIKDIERKEKAELEKSRYELNVSIQRSKANEKTLKRLKEKSGEDINSLSYQDQQTYYRAEEELNSDYKKPGGKIYLTPSVEKKLQDQTGWWSSLSRKSMQDKLNIINRSNNQADKYAMQYKANQSMVDALANRDNRTEVEVRRALAKNAMKFQKSRKDIIKQSIMEGVNNNLTMTQAKKNAFDSYIEKLNQQRGTY